MLSEALPIYPGALGNVAGDQLATSDLGVPVVGVKLLWQHGYFRQGDRGGRGRSKPSSRTTVLDNCRSVPCGAPTGSGYACG